MSEAVGWNETATAHEWRTHTHTQSPATTTAASLHKSKTNGRAEVLKADEGHDDGDITILQPTDEQRGAMHGDPSLSIKSPST